MREIKICADCLDSGTKLIWDKGQKVCPSCFHKRYGKKRFVNQNIQEKQFTFKDLKRQWERKW